MQSFKKYLNPLYKDVDLVSKFDDLKELTPLETEEYPNLQKVTKIKADSIKNLLPRLDKLEEELENQIYLIQTEASADARADAKSAYNQILGKITELVERINNELIALDSPYFGKIVFKPYESKNDKSLSLYIGKFALVENDTHIPLITDWRSPISNIYYENSGPCENVSFDTDRKSTRLNSSHRT